MFPGSGTLLLGEALKKHPFGTGLPSDTGHYRTYHAPKGEPEQVLRTPPLTARSGHSITAACLNAAYDSELRVAASTPTLIGGRCDSATPCRGRPLNPTWVSASHGRRARTARRTFDPPWADAARGVLRGSWPCRRRALLDAPLYPPRGEYRRHRGAHHDVADEGEVFELSVGRHRDDVAGDHRRNPT